MKNNLSIFTKKLLDVMFFAGIIVLIALPAIIYFFSNYNNYYKKYIVVMVIATFCSGIMALFIINELRKMFRTVINENCFVMENVASLKKMGNYSFITAAITFIRGFFYITPASIIIIIVFVVAGLFSKVLSEVFNQAVLYKNENDMTI